MFAMVLLGLLLAVAFQAGPNTDLKKDIDNGQNGDIEIYGKISRDTYDDFARYISKNPKGVLHVKISSPGGDARFAMLIGNLMSKRNTFLTIEKVCHSACAQYILPSATTISVKNGSSVAFHSSPSDLYLPLDASKKEKNDLINFREIEKRFYNDRNINANLVEYLRHQLEPVCYTQNKNRKFDGLQNYSIAYKYTVMVPSRDVLSSIGFPKISGYWPNSQNEIDRDAKRAGFQPRLQLKFLDYIPKNISTAEISLPKC
jgi:hypothetical protein